MFTSQLCKEENFRVYDAPVLKSEMVDAHKTKYYTLRYI